MLMYSRQKACFEHSNFFKVNDSELNYPSSEGQITNSEKMDHRNQHTFLAEWINPMKSRNPTTSFLTATTLIYAIGAGITAAAGTRLALQWILVKGFKLYSFQLPDHKITVLLFLVTTSLCQDWVICAPAAFLGCGSHFSGSLSGIEP